MMFVALFQYSIKPPCLHRQNKRPAGNAARFRRADIGTGERRHSPSDSGSAVGVWWMGFHSGLRNRAVTAMGR